jgi:tRNA pseudouridine55 synthase
VRSLAELRELSRAFHGEVSQLPPIYSAKKINGVAAHRLARRGADVPVKPVRITIHSFELTSVEGDVAGFTIAVSAGGYVRSVAHELGQLAGCGARAGVFTLSDAISIDRLKEATPGELEALMPHPRTLLPEMPSVTVDDQLAGRMRNGMQVNLPEYSQAPLIKVFTTPTEMLAIARRIAGTLVQPIVVMG